MEEFALEQVGDDLAGEEISCELGGYPSIPLMSQPPSCDDTVQMEMELESSAPAMKNRSDAEQGAETIGIHSQIEKGPGSRLEKQVKDEFPIVQRKRPDLTGEGEDGMEVVGGQETLLSLFDPSGLSQTLALGTVSVSARVVGGALMAALIAHVQMAAQSGSATGHNIPDDLVLLGRQHMSFDVGLPVNPEDVSDLEVRSHQSGLPAGRPMGVHGGLTEGFSLGGTDQVQRTFCAANMGGADLGVPGRSANRAVSQEHLNRANICAGFEKMRGECVTKYMRGDAFSKPRGLNRLAKG